MNRIHRIACLAAVAALAATSCAPSAGGQEKKLQSVAAATVRRQTVTRTVRLIGTVQGDRQATVMSKITGRVTEVVRAEGSSVSQGDPIVYIQNDLPGMDYKPGPVTAPVSGVVGKVHVDVGQTVAPGMPVATVADYSVRVRVRASVSDADLRFVRAGAAGRVTVSAFPDTSFAARVARVTPVLDQLSRSATVELVADNAGRRLVPGMACAVELVLEERADVVALPRSALFNSGTGQVAVLEGDTARFRPVVLGLAGDDAVEVISGVAEGERVITTGKERVEDGGAVRVVEGESR